VIVVLAVAEEDPTTVAMIERLPAAGGALKAAVYDPSLLVVADIGMVTPLADIVS
jgi:hypothetical protein